jgi:hypothetical protein
MITRLIVWLWWCLKFCYFRARHRWIGWRLGRRIGLDVNSAFRRAEEAGELARGRALLTDPSDPEAAERARREAHGTELARSLSASARKRDVTISPRETG